MLKEVRFAFQHDNCWLQETTTRHPSLTLVVSTVYMVGDEVVVDLTLHADRATVARAEDEWRADRRIRKVQRLFDGPRGVRFQVRYGSEPSVYPFILTHTPVALGAIRMAGGMEHYTVVGAAEDVQGLVRVLGEHGVVRVEAVRDLPQLGAAGDEAAAAAGDLLASLTDKQVEALVLAHAEGYYGWPRKVSATELAERLGLSSSAFLAHLRQGESRLLDEVVRALAERDPARVRAIKTRAGLPAAAP